MKFLLTAACCFFCITIKAQDFDWWRNNVNWDGVSHWYEYLIISPKYFGPNALPVPAVNNGSIDSLVSLGVTGNLHFSKGDNTQNLMFYGNYTAKNNIFSISMQFVPYERFQVSHAKKEERKVYYQEYYEDNTVGDVIFSTTVNFFQRWRKNIQLAGRVGVRMPSGGAQGAARYTDGPGYWIDLGWGLPIKGTGGKWVGTAGFYVWQTNEDALRQNDAFMFANGVEWNWPANGLMVQAYAAGYLGYKENGDKPVLLRFNLEKKFNKTVILLHLQHGLNDFDYSTVEFGTRFIFR
jgi:hypothetical protein